MTAARVLVVNADDFGLTSGVNEGVARAHEHGIVTAASLMVRTPAAEDAAAYARRRPELSVGLHLDLGEWECVDHEWRARYQVVDTGDAAAVEAEVDRQLQAFERLLGRAPTHLDSHQHVHRAERVRSALARAGARLRVPVRDVTPEIRYSGEFYGQDGRGYPVPQAITTEALIEVLERLPGGVTELGCHPGLGELDNVYAAEREREVRTLGDPAARDTLARLGIRLSSFADVRTDSATATGRTQPPGAASTAG